MRDRLCPVCGETDLVGDDDLVECMACLYMGRPEEFLERGEEQEDYTEHPPGSRHI